MRAGESGAGIAPEPIDTRKRKESRASVDRTLSARQCPTLSTSRHIKLLPQGRCRDVIQTRGDKTEGWRLCLFLTFAANWRASFASYSRGGNRGARPVLEGHQNAAKCGTAAARTAHPACGPSDGRHTRPDHRVGEAVVWRKWRRGLKVTPVTPLDASGPVPRARRQPASRSMQVLADVRQTTTEYLHAAAKASRGTSS